MKVRGRTNRGNPYTLSNYFGKLKESLEMGHITAENNKEDFFNWKCLILGALQLKKASHSSRER